MKAFPKTANDAIQSADALWREALDALDSEDRNAIEALNAVLLPLLDTHAALLSEIDFNDFGGSVHEKPHALRVLIFALLIGGLESLEKADLTRLSLAAVFHDSRREDDDLDTGHGMRASLHYAAWAEAQGLSPEPLVRHALAFHDLPDMLGCGIAVEPKMRLLTQIFKDADALDRYRFGPDGLDPSYLRRPAAKRLMRAARRLNGLPSAER